MSKMLRNEIRQDMRQEAFSFDPVIKPLESHFATTIMAEKRH